jgi:hypothetical protein
MTTTLRRPRRIEATAPPAARVTTPMRASSGDRPGGPRGWTHVLRGAASGAAAGVTWGVTARIWMRLVATDPSFTWSGTLFILGAATLAGTLLGLALAGRDGRFPRLARAVGAISILPLGLGAGVVLLPAVVAGTLAGPGRVPRLAWRLVAAGLPCVAILVTGFDGSTLRWAAVGLVGAVVLGAVARTFRPLMAIYATAAVGVVAVPMFDGTRSVVRATVVSVLYVALLLPLTSAYHGAVRRRDIRSDHHAPPGQPDQPDPPTTVGGTAPSEELT